MKRSLNRAVWIPLAICVGIPAAALGQQLPPIVLPEASPAASVRQAVGMTDIEVRYHRPAVNGRKVWGELVPWDEVWRAGANENTTISFDSPVTVEGKPLAAGTYGLHMVPSEKQWNVVFSKVSDAWGSFAYDEKDDALRVAVEPRPAEAQERLSYSFEDPTEKSATLLLRWEKLGVPIRIEVDTPSVVVERLRGQLHGLPRFSWQGWNNAAAYCLRAGVNMDEAMQWADRSISMNENFNNLNTKAGLLEKKGDTKAAEALRAKSLKIATEADMNLRGYGLLGEKKLDEAIAVFQKNVKDHPRSWNTYDSLAEAYATKGDKKLAIEQYGRAMAMTTDEQQKKRIAAAITKLKS